MSKKKNSQRKPSSPSAEAGEYDDLPETISSSVLQDLLKAQECMFKSFMESVMESVSNLTSRIDNLVKDFAGLKSSLEFSQKDIASHDEQLSAIGAELKNTASDVANLQTAVNKHLQKTVYLENQSRRNNLRFEGLLEDTGETWETTEEKVKKVLADKLNIEPVPEIERAHGTGRPTRHDGTPKPRTVVCKFTSYKAKESILKAARRMRPEGINIFEDLAEETMEKRRAQLPQLRQAKARGKIAFFSLDRLIIKDRPNGSATMASCSLISG